MPIRIMCCSGSLEAGGSERQLWQLAVGLPAAQFATQIYVINRRGPYLWQIPEHIRVHDFASQDAPTATYWPGAIHRRQVRHLARTLHEQHIDIVYDRTFHMTLLTAAACRATHTARASVIVSPPSQDFVRSREHFRWIKKRLLARAYRDPASVCLAVADSVAYDAAQFYGLDLRRIRVIPSPIDIAAVDRAALSGEPSQWNVSTDEAMAPQKPFRWLVVGRLSREKGQRLAIEAMALMRSMRPEAAIELTLVGEGPDRQSLVELVDQFGLQSSIRLMGAQSNPYPFMRSANLLCIPSSYEGLPNVALEGMCVRTPIVATACSGSLRELLGAEREGDEVQLADLGETGQSARDIGRYREGLRGVLIRPGDVEALARAVLDCLDHRRRWQERAKAARQWVCQRHALQPWLTSMQQLFEEMKPK